MKASISASSSFFLIASILLLIRLLYFFCERLYRHYIAVGAETRYYTLAYGGSQRALAKLFARADIGKMNLNCGCAGTGNRVSYCDACVRVCRRIYDDGIAFPCFGADFVDYLAFMIRLKNRDAYPERFCTFSDVAVDLF